MKRILSVILSVALLVSCFAFSANAASYEGTKTQAIIAQLMESKTVSFDIKDGTVSGDGFDLTELDVMFKIDEQENGVANLKMAASAKSGSLKLHAYSGAENLIYIENLRCYVNINEFLETDARFDFTILSTGVNMIFKYLNTDALGDLVLTYSGNREIKGYGEVYVERFGTKAEFYYRNDVLVGFKATVLNENYVYVNIASTDFLPDFVEGIKSNVPASEFEKPTGFYINITPLAKFIYELIKAFKG